MAQQDGQGASSHSRLARQLFRHVHHRMHLPRLHIGFQRFHRHWLNIAAYHVCYSRGAVNDA